MIIRKQIGVPLLILLCGIASAQLAGGPRRAGPEQGIGIGERRLEWRARVEPVQRAGGDPDALEEGRAAVEQAKGGPLQGLGRDPAAGRGEAAEHLRRGAHRGQHLVEPVPLSGLEREHRGGEGLDPLV